MGEGRSAFKTLTDKHTRKRNLGETSSGLAQSFTMDLKEICMNTMNWVDSAQVRDYWGAVVNAALNLEFHKS